MEVIMHKSMTPSRHFAEAAERTLYCKHGQKCFHQHLSYKERLKRCELTMLKKQKVSLNKVNGRELESWETVFWNNGKHGNHRYREQRIVQTKLSPLEFNLM